LKQINSEVVFLTSTYQEAVERIKGYLETHQGITVAEARDLFDSSRRYMLALLEHMDGQGITVRVGDIRHLKRTA
jgi:selenocysteine-specific elongation factor